MVFLCFGDYGLRRGVVRSVLVMVVSSLCIIVIWFVWVVSILLYDGVVMLKIDRLCLLVLYFVFG